jgi:hypothetical protein
MSVRSFIAPCCPTDGCDGFPYEDFIGHCPFEPDDLPLLLPKPLSLRASVYRSLLLLLIVYF